MSSGSWWIIKGFMFLYVSQFGFCDLSNQVCVIGNGTSREDCYGYEWVSFGNMVPSSRFEGVVFLANPKDACTEVMHKSSYPNISYDGNVFLLIDFGHCKSFQKGIEATRGGFDAAIIRSLTSDEVDPIDEGEIDDVDLPVVFVGKRTGEILENNDFENLPNSRVYLTPQQLPPLLSYEFYMIPFAIIVGICFILMAMFMISRYYRHYLEQRRNRLSPSTLKKIPTKKFKKGEDYYDVCAICLDEYKDGDRLRILPCEHAYHCKCVDPWLTEGKRTCPVCKRPVANNRGLARSRSGRTDLESVGETSYEAEAEADETTPLISGTSQRRNSVTMTV
ncbi:E3 ubiquitin-protein ligase RNF13-like [Pocillopora damicornis]|nr:E3 ubiquitin-protein ligase RNF13-like [Pocillopora damicornis]